MGALKTLHVPSVKGRPASTTNPDIILFPESKPRRSTSDSPTNPRPPSIQPLGNRSAFYRISKRILDVVIAGMAVVVLSPLLLAVTAILAVSTKGKPFFVQQRVGYRGRLFPMIKFRTMRLDAEKLKQQIKNQHQDGPIFKNRQDPRITRIGRFLRKSSIDEMPQLLNVFLGHMSLVGPRPPVPKEVAEYEPWHNSRLAIKPGLTCLWQVSGRSDIGFQDWVRMDIWYAKNQSLWTDFRLLLKTPWTVITGRGAY